MSRAYHPPPPPKHSVSAPHTQKIDMLVLHNTSPSGDDISFLFFALKLTDCSQALLFIYALFLCVDQNIRPKRDNAPKLFTRPLILYSWQNKTFFLIFNSTNQILIFSDFLFYVSLCAPNTTIGGWLIGPEGPGGKLRLNGQGVPVKAAPFQASGGATSKDPQILLM